MLQAKGNRRSPRGRSPCAWACTPARRTSARRATSATTSTSVHGSPLRATADRSCSRNATAELVELELTDLGEHRLKDMPVAVSIFQLGNGSFPPLKTISNTNLPTPASSFVGRDDELLEVLSRIEDGARLVTLTGPGGTGKTRLAIEAAADARSRVQGRRLLGRARHAARSGARHGDDRADARRQGRPRRAHRRPRDAVAARQPRAGDRLLRPSSRSSSTACPNLTLLVTSRELLRIQGEVEYAVPPLAERRQSRFSATRSQLDADETIAELCRRLDNLPLAVELAAARTKALTPEQILERLSQRLDLLKGGRDADPASRHSERRSSGRTSCCQPRSSSSSPACPSSPAAARWRPPRRSPTPTSTPCSRWSRRASLRFTDGATGCSRRSASTRRSVLETRRAEHEAPQRSRSYVRTLALAEEAASSSGTAARRRSLGWKPSTKPPSCARGSAERRHRDELELVMHVRLLDAAGLPGRVRDWRRRARRA